MWQNVLNLITPPLKKWTYSKAKLNKKVFNQTNKAWAGGYKTLAADTCVISAYGWKKIETMWFLLPVRMEQVPSVVWQWLRQGPVGPDHWSIPIFSHFIEKRTTALVSQSSSSLYQLPFPVQRSHHKKSSTGTSADFLFQWMCVFAVLVVTSHFPKYSSFIQIFPFLQKKKLPQFYRIWR